MSFSPTARPTLDLLESRDVATIGLLGGLFHGVSLLNCHPTPVACPPVSLPKCDVKVELPKCDVKVELPKCDIKVELPKCETPKVETPKCEPKKVETPKCEPKKVETPKCDTPADKKDEGKCEVKKDIKTDDKCEVKKEVKKDCFTPADLVCKIVSTKVSVVKKFSLFGKC